MASRDEQAGPYRTAFRFSRTGIYVSPIYATIFVRSNSGAVENTHEKESNEEEKHPDCKDMIGPPPVKVLSSIGR